MKIISIKNSFTSDHSSTSYEFLAVDKPLGKKERGAVASLSSRANPSTRRVSFIYHVDGYDIPGGWEKLMEKYYDVMYRGDYDWWTLAIAFKSSEKRVSELREYEFTGEDDLGIDVLEHGNRVIIVINCRLDDSYIDEPDYDDDEEAGAGNTDRFVAENYLLNLLLQLRGQLQQGDYRSLYAVWEKYRFSEDNEYEDDDDLPESPPVPPEKPQGKSIIEQFKKMLE